MIILTSSMSCVNIKLPHNIKPINIIIEYLTSIIKIWKILYKIKLYIKHFNYIIRGKGGTTWNTSLLTITRVISARNSTANSSSRSIPWSCKRARIVNLSVIPSIKWKDKTVLTSSVSCFNIKLSPLLLKQIIF